MSAALDKLLPLLAQTGQPQTIFKAFEEVSRELVGHKLFTMLYVDGDEVARIYSNRPAEYPLSGRKTMGPTQWGDLVLKQCKPYLGKDKAAVRWAFFDHPLIESMGLGSTLNIPILYNGKTIGTLNLLDVEHHYTEAHVPLIEEIAPVLIPAFIAARAKAHIAD